MLRHAVRRMSAMVVAGALLAGAHTAAAADTRTPDQQLLSQINAIRTARGLAPLRFSAVLIRAARSHTGHMMRTGSLSHVGTGGSTFDQRIYGAGFPRRPIGENLGLVSGCGPAATRAIVRAWLRSPGHRGILLSSRYRVIGTGVMTRDGCAATIVTADFGG